MISQIQWAGYGAALAGARPDPDLAEQALTQSADRRCSSNIDATMGNRMTAELFDLPARSRSSPAAMAASASAWRADWRKPAPTIAVVGRNEAKSNAAVAELRAARRQGDLRRRPTSPTRRGRRHGRARQRELGRIDILVNNAGINIRKPPHALDSRNGTA